MSTVRFLVAAAAVPLAIVTCAVAVAAPASAATPSPFTPGDVVVYRVGSGTGALDSSATATFLDEYSPAGALVESVPLPTATAGSQHALTASGTGGSEGLLTLSADGRYLVATGYSAATGTTKITSSAAATVPRTIARVGADASVDTSTALTDAADGNNPRSATSNDGQEFWFGGAAGGVRYATPGATTSTPLTSSTYKNVRQVGIADGQLYTSADPTKAGLTIGTVGTGLPTAPTAGTQTPTPLTFDTAPVDPYAYSFVTLGSSSATPDTVYVADAGSSLVRKFTLTNGTWTANGTVAVPNVTGVTADDINGTVTIYATTSGSTGATGSLYSITDTSGLGALSGTPTTLATAPTNEAFRGVAFAPGTVFGSGGAAPPAPEPTVVPDQNGLPAAIDDPTNPTLPVTVGDPLDDAGTLTLTATSSNQSVAADSGISLSGTGATRTLTVTPGSVGTSTVTLTVTTPDNRTQSTTIEYGVSADQGDPSDRYYSGAGNLSAAVDVGNGYFIGGDDGNNTLRLYNGAQSGQPVRSFDFTAQFPNGATSIDIEASTRIGNTIYWTGSLSNTGSGNAAPARSTLFATTVSGSGADTQLTWAGSFGGLRADLVNWDHDNLHGLGADYFGLQASTAVGVTSHDPTALDIEGMEAAPGNDGTVYLAVRSPLEPASARTKALIVPLTNMAAVVSGTASTATFGAPMLFDLGGLGIRDLRRNADGQYLLIAGTADGSNARFSLYDWDGNPAHAPALSPTQLPLIPSGTSQGAWETIVSVPDPLTTGSSVRLIEDNGDTAWYGDGATAKDTLLPALQKDLGRTFTYTQPPVRATTTTVTSSTADPAVPASLTYTAVVAPTDGAAGPPAGTVSFADRATTISGCSAQPLDATGTATCAVSYTDTGRHLITAAYTASRYFGASASPTFVQPVGNPVVTITADDQSRGVGQSDPAFSYAVTGLSVGDRLSTSPMCGVTGSDADAGSYPITCSGAVAPSGYTIVYVAGTLTVTATDTTTTLAVSPAAPVTGQPITLTATVASTRPGVPAPGGTVDFRLGGSTPAGCSAVAVGTDGTATCAISAGRAPSKIDASAAYSGDQDHAASQSGPTSVTVAPAGTSVVVTASPHGSVTGQAVTLRARVQALAPGVGTPSGTVTFTLTNSHRPAVQCSSGPRRPLSKGLASCTVAAGDLYGTTTYRVTARYSGDTGFTARAATQSIAIRAARTTTTVGSTITRTKGQSALTARATLAAVAPGRGVPTGRVRFTVTSGGTSLRCRGGNAVTLRAGSAACALPLERTGARYAVVAHYLGSSEFAASAGRLRPRPDPTTRRSGDPLPRCSAGEDPAVHRGLDRFTSGAVRDRAGARAVDRERGQLGAGH